MTKTFSETDINGVMARYSDTVWRVCALYLTQKADREDAFQDTFVRYVTSDAAFDSSEHEKAWFIRVATNVCKDMLKSAAHRTVPLDTFDEDQEPLGMQGCADEGDAREGPSPLLEALRALPEKYRVVLYLTYFEGYRADEIGKMLDKPVNTVYTDLARGRGKLKEVLEDGQGRS